MNKYEKPKIVAFVSDLMFSLRIESAADQIDFMVIFLESVNDFSYEIQQKREAPGEALAGLRGALMDRISQLQPALMLFDLNNQHIPWQDWIPLLKSVPATRRIPILAFGPHMDVDTITLAKDVGADVVVGRSRLVSSLPELLSQYARIPNYAAIEQACQDPLSHNAIEGLNLFNQGEYFEAHEKLEEAWNQDQTAARNLYKAIIQVAVAYLQIERGNFRGAAKMFLRMRQWLQPLPPKCRGIDIEQLRLDAAVVETTLGDLGPDEISNFDRKLLKRIQFNVLE